MNTKHTVPGTATGHEYVIGETVVVTIVGPITSLSDPAVTSYPSLYLTVPSAGQIRIPLGVHDIQVVRGIPADGEPQVGDVWRDRTGAKHFVLADDGYLELVDEKNRRSTWQRLHESPLTGPIELMHRDDARAAGVSDRHSVPRPQLPVLPADYFADELAAEPASVARP